VIVALGGDGFLLQTMRETMSTGKRVYGMNRGTIGFLMNEYNERICRSASPTPAETIRPLEMTAECDDGTQTTLLPSTRSRFGDNPPDGQIASVSTARCGLKD
jgi:NAD+ kinase